MAAAVLFPAPQADAVSGPIEGNVTWSGTVNLTGDVWVTSTGSLTIQPGTKVLAAWNSDDQIHGWHTSRVELIVQVGGTLSAQGTLESPIVFTSNRYETDPLKGDWYGIRVASDTVTMSYCNVEWGINGLCITAGAPSVENCYLYSNSNNGLYISSASPQSFPALYVHHNNADGVYMADSTTATFSACQIYNNSERGVYLGYYTTTTFSGCFIQDNTANGLYALYYGVLTLTDCDVSGNGGYGIATYSNTTVNGGRITGNGSYALRSWSGALDLNAANIANNTSYGVYGGTVSAVNCDILNNGGTGIRVSAIGSGGFTGNCITGNNIGVRTVSSGTLALPGGNDINNNANYELYNEGSGAVVASGNYWGDPTTSECQSAQVNLTKIYDSHDNAGVGQVIICNDYLSAPVACGGCTEPEDCDDGDACTDDDCIDNQCEYTDVNCGDGNPCTDDTCDPVLGCQNTCQEGESCTIPGGMCQPDTPGQCVENAPDQCVCQALP